MTEEIEIIEGSENVEKEEIFSNAVRAGKRTYFFDVKATKRNDYYLTITESKKRYNKDGRFFYEKHKIFLYKEDFEKFIEGLEDVVGFIKTHQTEEFVDSAEPATAGTFVEEKSYTNVDFEDLEIGVVAEDVSDER
ncbi:MAG: PUR family DNA/RNA-binding protein [Bacteroidales bacterium]|nr:PUR family DNA/RNA-binding protein [Bacteroidales bacterium]